MLSQKTIRGNFAAKILKTKRAKQKNKTKARGELFASSFPNFNSRETHADLTNQLLAWTGCRQRLLFARHLIPRKCSLCSQGRFSPSLKMEPFNIVDKVKEVDEKLSKIKVTKWHHAMPLENRDWKTVLEGFWIPFLYSVLWANRFTQCFTRRLLQAFYILKWGYFCFVRRQHFFLTNSTPQKSCFNIFAWCFQLSILQERKRLTFIPFSI